MPRKPKYREEYAEQAKKLCALGATNEDLAEFFGITRTSIDNWINDKPDFGEAVRAGRELPDDHTEASLYRRGQGVTTREMRTTFGGDGNVKEQVEITKEHPPDTTACIFWLKNRRGWRDKQDVDHNHRINVVEVSDEEVAPDE